MIQGARQVGKTTLVRSIADELDGRLITFDDELTREAAQADPQGFLRAADDGFLAIDEVQRVPGIVLALKLAVDRNTRPGQFLLTGSADLLRLPATGDSLAGRAESIELHGFSQGEIGNHPERFIDLLLQGNPFTDHISSLTRRDYLDRAISGSYPEALARPAGRRRNSWLDNYLERIVHRDAPDISSRQRLDELPRILRVLASQNSEELNVTGLASDLAIPASTLKPLLDLLETLYLVQRIPAWSTNLTRRVVSRPKVALLDTGLTARLINVSVDGASPAVNGDVAGHLLEGFVAGELRKQLAWAEENVQMYHYRDRVGSEVDLILETGDGRVAGIEVKATSMVGGHDVKWLAMLRDKLGDRFVQGIVLHTGPTRWSFQGADPAVGGLPSAAAGAPPPRRHDDLDITGSSRIRGGMPSMGRNGGWQTEPIEETLARLRRSDLPVPLPPVPRRLRLRPCQGQGHHRRALPATCSAAESAPPGRATTAAKHRCAAIRCSSPSTPRPPAAAAAWRNGTASPPGTSSLRPSWITWSRS
ncbi:MAG: ATP-binding protein [Acidipropionibacterium sp.]|nr:ATP-binding protein [Acidipropionibacterium sp.]